MPNALVITAAGINCDLELAEAFRLAGATVESIHLNQLIEKPALIERFDVIGIPGGFSYGDAVAAGRIAAQLMRRTLYGALVRAVQRGVPIIAPCNGFQIAAQIGLLPGPPPGEAWPADPPPATIGLAPNTSARYSDRWVRTEVPPGTRCVWTAGLDQSPPGGAMLPIAHGEGRLVCSPEVLEGLRDNGQVALVYAADDNPNGSVGNVAGICDASGLVLGLMPHPERFTRWTQHPWWTRLGDTTASVPLGLAVFCNALKGRTNQYSPRRGCMTQPSVA